MKFEVPKMFLEDAVKKARFLVKEKTPQYYATVYLLTAESGWLKLTINNMENALEVKMPSKVSEEGRVLVPAVLFTKLIQSLPDSFINVEMNENFRLTLSADNVEVELQGEDPKYFPDFTKEAKSSFSLNVETLKRSLEHVIFACFKQEFNIISGVYMGAEENVLNIVGLDGNRMGLVRENIDVSFDPLVIPQKSAIFLLKFLPELEDEITISPTENSILFSAKNWIFQSQLLKDKYPNFKAIVGGREFPHYIKVDRKELLKALDIILALKFLLAIFEYRDGTLRLKTESSEKSSFNQTLNLIEDGFKEDYIIGFNPTYLHEVLKVIEDDEVIIRFSKTNIEPIQVEPVSYQYIYLMMPIRL